MRNLLILGLIAGATVEAGAQMVCGTPAEAMLKLTAQTKKLPVASERGAIKYIPVTFHLVAAANGTGRVTEEAVLNQLANLNAQFADQEMLFYIDRFNYFEHNIVYETPAASAATPVMRLRKDNNSLNVYITNKADSGSGTPGVTLAYYDPAEDWVVSRKDQINGTSSTLSHEIGHFFSLSHPHAGWEYVPYSESEYGNPVTLTHTLPGGSGQGSRLIELHNRSNCAQAGDLVCDTPEDYNLGFSYQSGCAQNTTVMDKNGELITPMTHNVMGYYNNCSAYAFTAEQTSLMTTNYLSFFRNYIRTGIIPNTNPVQSPVTYISPANGQETSTSSDILLDWEDAENATHYLVIYARNSTFTFNPVRKIVQASEFLIEEELLTGITYYWKVWPYNESQTGAGFSPARSFIVGTGVSVNDIREIDAYYLLPNPSGKGQPATLALSSSTSFDGSLQIADIAGRILSSSRLAVPAGESSHILPTADLPGGLYVVFLRSAYGKLVTRLIITD